MPGAGFAAKSLRITYDIPFFHLLVATLLIYSALSGFVGRALDNRFLRATATLSFGIYLWHDFLILCLGAARPALVRPATMAATLGLYALVLPIAYAVAAASYFLLEGPVLRWGHRYKAAPKPAAPRSELGPGIGDRELDETRPGPTA